MSHPSQDGNRSAATVIGYPTAAIGHPWKAHRNTVIGYPITASAPMATDNDHTKFAVKAILLVTLVLFFSFAYVTRIINAPPCLPNFKLQPSRPELPPITFPSSTTASFNVSVDFSLENPSIYSHKRAISYDHITVSLFYKSIFLSSVSLAPFTQPRGQRNAMKAGFLVPMSELQDQGHARDSLTVSARFTLKMGMEVGEDRKMERGSMTVECDHVLTALGWQSTMILVNDGSPKCHVRDSTWISCQSFEHALMLLLDLALLSALLFGLLLGHYLYAKWTRPPQEI